MKMSRQNAEEEKCTQPASQIVRGRQKIHLLWRSPLDSPDKKRCPLKSWSKHYEEARVMKKNQIIWHKLGKLKKKKIDVSRGFVQPRLSQGALVFWSTSWKFHTAVETPLPSLFFILMQMKNCTGSHTITPTRPPAGSKMDLCWGTATWSLTAETEQEKPQTTLSQFYTTFDSVETSENLATSSEQERLRPFQPISFNLCSICLLQDSWNLLPAPCPPALAGVQQKLDVCFAESNLIKLFRGFTRLHLAIYSCLRLHWVFLH